ncbi:MAG TPA: GTP 3',8-cyclase MoaA [Bdellovibrionota bacterium]|nr:GTP 3',8-cyclase MoaA [Bdellovibrionota bacterium]
MEQHLVDSFNRRIDYVRLSVTDQCNFQCFYCRPPLSRQEFIPDSSYLSCSDIEKLFFVLGKMGVRKVKITGGEPLLRGDIGKIIEVLSKNPHIHDISLITNGFFLEHKALALKEAGLKRVNVSLDSLNSKTFHAVTKTQSFSKVWHGILRAIELGFENIKLNVVLMKGINTHEMCEFVNLSLNYPLTVRFIEFMPTLQSQKDQEKFFFSNEEAKRLIEKNFSLLSHVESERSGPARYFQVNGQGKIGFISPLSEHFCDSCNRIRITAKGALRLCLFSYGDTDMLSQLRSQNWESEVENTLREKLYLKPFRHELSKKRCGDVKSFVSIGG